ncbi:MAG: hypothetical protein NUV65_00820 [Candidatus Roizmanbacteria bacterium]|nr:hypothetical protein [Candidatus Roizmanbacteria bacterium]
MDDYFKGVNPIKVHKSLLSKAVKLKKDYENLLERERLMCRALEKAGLYYKKGELKNIKTKGLK